MQKSVGLVYPAAMMAFNFMNTPVKHEGEDKIVYRFEPGGGMQLGKLALRFRQSPEGYRARRLAVLGARNVDGSHVASEYGREECYSFVPGPKHGKDNDEKLYHTGGEDGGTRQAFVCGQVVPFLVQRDCYT